MNALLLSAALVAAPPPGDAIAPYVYAGFYCEARSGGFGYEESIRMAVELSTRRNHPSSTVVIEGESYRSDYVAGAYLVHKLCPQWLSR